MNPNALEWPLIVAALLPWGALVAVALIAPRVSRPELLFAVTVNPSFRLSPAGRQIIRRYDRSVIAVALAALVPVAFISLRSPAMLYVGLLGPVGVALAGWLCVFVDARRRTIPHHVEPTAEREAVMSPRTVSLPGGLVGQGGPFLILAAVCVALWLRWDGIPARIPIHWNLSGNPDGWSARTFWSVYGSAATGVLICGFIAALWIATTRGVRRIYGSGARAAGGARFIRVMSLFMLGMEYWLALLFGLLSLAALRSDPSTPLNAFWPILGMQTLVIGAIVVLSLRSGQGGWRLEGAGEASATSAETPPVGDRTPDACWKLGMIYFNRDDPALFVEKRFGLGWTINMANPRSLLVLSAILLFVAAAMALAMLIGRGR